MHTYRIGADENGLGAQLGPMITTAVLARVTERGLRFLASPLRGALAEDLADSKELVSHHDVTLGEAWARVLTGHRAASPNALFAALSLEGLERLQSPCPRRARRQCWNTDEEQFGATADQLSRVGRHRETMASRGVEVLRVLASVACTQRLNRELEADRSRFAVDLHAMEELVLTLQGEVGTEVYAVCGKVGGIADYSRFFGPLSTRLHGVLGQTRGRSSYYFPGLGQLHFVMDADAHDPLVMLASLIGKYLRELLMARITRYYASVVTTVLQGKVPSGYHDGLTNRFVRAAADQREAHRIPLVCFQRTRRG